MEEQKEREQTPAERVGVDYGMKLSYAAVNASDAANKRDVLYSLVCFGCMIDERYATDPDPIVRKYDCLTYPEPNKLDPYELVRTMVTLSGITDEQKAELRKIWYLLFPYVLIAEAPHSQELYDELVRIMHTQDNFEAVLKSRYSMYITPTAEELYAQGAPRLLVEWYEPYLEYTRARDEHGVTREVAECRRLLALGEFDQVLMRAERLIAVYPDDFELAVTDIAARVSLSGVTDASSRDRLLRDTLSMIDDYMDVAPSLYFRYYRGLTLLGLMDTVGARAEFERCLELDPKFELAALMLKGMDSKLS